MPTESTAGGATGTTGDPELATWSEARAGDWIRFRRHLHAHPELGGEEHETTELVEGHLRSLGLEPHRLSSGTGLICEVAGARPGPTIALRADLDALPMQDDKSVGYRSTVAGVAHACGHDVHTTALLGAAQYLCERRDEVAGAVRLIFQPAEERTPGGALDVLADDGLDGVDAIVGLHCEPKAPVGTIGLRSGAITSASDRVEIALRGPGGHTARPELTTNLLEVAGRLLWELPARLRDHPEVGGAVKLVFGTAHGGHASNVVPATCDLGGTVRTQSLDLWERLPRLLEIELASLTDGTGAETFLDHTRGVPPVVNDDAVIDVLRGAVGREFGDAACYEPPQSWGGDDFAWYTRQVPGAYVRLGTHAPDGPELDLHAGHFDVDERAIAIGVRMLVRSAGALAAAVR